MRNEYIVSSSDKLVKIYEKLFNTILNLGVVPVSWSFGIIKPLYKNKGSMNNVDSSRGITLLSTLGKVFTSLLNARLNQFANEINLIGIEQAGYRKGQSTTDQFFSLKCLIDLYLKSGKKLYCTFIDYQKAFNTINHADLWFKLLQNGIDGKIVNVIRNIYRKTKSCVMIKDNKSEFFSCNIGVRQGENLSPFLFSIYLNDLHNFVLDKNRDGLRHIESLSQQVFLEIGVYLKLFLILYADDTAILADSEHAMQNCLNVFFNLLPKVETKIEL